MSHGKGSRFRATSFGLAIVLAIAIAAFGRGNWLHQVFSYSALLWIGVPTLAIAVISLIKRWTRAVIVALSLILLIGVQLPLGQAFLHWDIGAGKRYCERLLPALETIHAERGNYPLTLDEDERLDIKKPLLVRTGDVFYSSDGVTFSFDVHNPAELFGGFFYASSEPQWVEWRD